MCGGSVCRLCRIRAGLRKTTTLHKQYRLRSLYFSPGTLFGTGGPSSPSSSFSQMPARIRLSRHCKGFVLRSRARSSRQRVPFACGSVQASHRSPASATCMPSRNNRTKLSIEPRRLAGTGSKWQCRRMAWEPDWRRLATGSQER
jgi:hypothetical protein